MGSETSLTSYARHKAAELYEGSKALSQVSQVVKSLSTSVSESF